MYKTREVDIVMYITLHEETQHLHEGMYVRVQSLDTHTIRSGFAAYHNRNEQQRVDAVQHLVKYLKSRVTDEE